MRRLLVPVVLATLALVLVGCEDPPGDPPPPQPGHGPIACPVMGNPWFTNDWHAPRGGGALHEGNDLFLPEGTPVLAATSGFMSHRTGSRTGLGAWLSGDNGHSYFYAHMSMWEGTDRRVVRGEVIGYVGMTGDAQGTAPHLHFQIHQHSSSTPRNPYKTLLKSCPNR